MEEQTSRLASLDISKQESWKHVSIATDTKKGKSVIATADIKPSTTILQEQSFIRQLNPEFKELFCDTCFKELDQEKVRCRKSCEWNIHYCSTACEEEGWTSGHEWLCKFPELEELNSEVLLAFQGYIKSRALNCNELPGLISNLNKHTKQELQTYRENAQLLKDHVHDMDMLVKIQAQLKCNTFAIKSTQSSHVEGYDLVVSRDPVRLGQAVFLNASVLNHACSPNAIVMFDKEQPTLLRVLVTENVSKDQEVTISYGPIASRLKKEERQRLLLEGYYFECDCKDCSDKSVDRASTIYKCQICKKGRLYRNQETCKSCETKPNWNHFIKTEEAIENSHDLLKKLQLQESILHSDTLAIGETADHLAQRHCMSGDFKTAAKYCQRSMIITRLNYGAVSLETAEEMMKLSSLYFNAQMKKEAINQISATLKLYKELGLNDSDDIDELETMMSYTLYMR
ncbi:hypothetical protein K501DRAFT_250465 [Backusella circina FSU 941]|nr:hypothetical protein K501DRAFT_250465 [Backusella circina FSU 941]